MPAKAATLPRGANKPDNHRRLIMAVRAACRAQGIGDDDRKALQLELTGKRSLADMTPAEMGRVLDRLNKDRSKPQAHRPHVAKIRALWWSLYWLGAVDDAGERALDAFVERQTGVASLRFLDHSGEASVVEALKAWARREGVRWPDATELKDMAAADPDCTPAVLERWAVLSAIGLKLENTGRVLSFVKLVEAALGLGLNQWRWSAAEYDAAIRLLGTKRRTLLGKGSDQ